LLTIESSATALPVVIGVAGSSWLAARAGVAGSALVPVAAADSAGAALTGAGEAGGAKAGGMAAAPAPAAGDAVRADAALASDSAEPSTLSGTGTEEASAMDQGFGQRGGEHSGKYKTKRKDMDNKHESDLRK
jgi:hypothetical protein